MDAIVDTGFNGFLTLPATRVWRLGLIQIGESTIELADGSAVESPIYDGLIVWGGTERLVRVQVADGKPLVGMKMLEGSDLRMEVRSGGRILIEPLTPSY